MISCINPDCRHRNKRKLRPLVITLLPPTTDQNNESSLSSDPTPIIDSNFTRQEQITHMFASHPSLVAHFEPPAFSPGVPSRELRNRLKFLEHCNDAGIVPDVEWEGICRAVREQQQQQTTTSVADIASNRDQVETVGCSKSLENAAESTLEANKISKVINPFKYLAVETLIQSHVGDDDDDKTNCKSNRIKTSNKNKKKKRWLEYETKSLIPISPYRRGSPEDILLPYSMEIWRKAKTLNRDRSVLACTLAHLKAMKTLVRSHENENDNYSLDDDIVRSCAGKFDFILEDNTRAFVGMVDNGMHPETEGASEWSCECASRIWDIIEASNASQSACHMRYYGWLGSMPNLAWIYGNHIPRSTLNDTLNAHAEGCVIFPYPTNEDFELDAITPSSKSTNDFSVPVESPSNRDVQASSSVEASSTPQFTTPGGTAAVWGTFAYTVSSDAYLSFIHRLQNDVGSLMWKGKTMRAYKAKPIDKILPRHVISTYGSRAVHVPAKVAFVRGPMVSLLHPQWDAGFRRSTELQYCLSCVRNEKSLIDQHADDVWDHVWLEKEERGLVEHKQNGDHSDHEKGKRSAEEKAKHRLSGRMSIGPSLNLGMLANMMMLFAVSFSGAFSFSTQERKLPSKLRSHASKTDNHINRERKLGKIGNVPIISRSIQIDVNFLSDLPQREHSDDHIYSAGNGNHRLDVTVWEMYQPSELIQEWWSIDRLEQERRVGDPFGVVTWPGSIMASKELMKQHLRPPKKSPLRNATVLVLGAGTGVEALTAAILGAKRVIATDINPFTLKLLERGANNDDRVGDNFSCAYFDLFSEEPLPACDVLVVADVLYNAELARQVGLRLHDAIIRSFNEGEMPLKVIVTDSQKFHGTNFLEEVTELHDLNELFKENDFEQLEWKSYRLENVCGSGVLVDEDQIYDVDVRMINWGW